MTKVVHVIGNDPSTISMFANAGWNCWDQNPDLVCFTGGADISPELYCQGNVASYNCNPYRDISEVGQAIKYTRLGVPMVGICRGAQLLNVLMGGSMIQDITPAPHSGKRFISVCDRDGRFLYERKVSEDHHQGMVPDSTGTILGIDRVDKNVEIVLYDIIDPEGPCPVLCFQAHPEWGHDGTRQLFFQMIEEYLL